MKNTQPQAKEREALLQNILDSSADKIIIVAGAGTGKTYTFRQLLKKTESKNNLVMTFIRRLVNDMHKQLSDYGEIKTFHEYAIGQLYKVKGSKYELVSYLPKLIKMDASLTGLNFKDFQSRFQILEENCGEIKYYLERGDYYKAVSFDDSVYRLYKHCIENTLELPEYDLILIDEYQDFNKMEVAVIKELESRGRILIAGDDDQAVYSGRNSTSDHLRALFNSSEYESYELPFCSRCPEVIVESVNGFIANVSKKGYLNNRIERRYIPFTEDKKDLNNKYPKVITACLTTFPIITKFIESEIKKIDEDDIVESHNEENPYPTALIIGTRQYLNHIYKKLKPKFRHIIYNPSTDADYNYFDAYKLLRKNEESNLGWRIISELFLDSKQLKELVEKSYDNEPIIMHLNENFIDEQKYNITLVNSLDVESDTYEDVLKELTNRLGKHYDSFKLGYKESLIQEEEVIIDKTEPHLLLTSYEGCKGLSGGHVFIVGAVNGNMPRNQDSISDIEISKFIVAMTRTRKCCYILSNKWQFDPKKDSFPSKPSIFLDFIPNEFMEDRGTLKSADISI
ncbi:MAG: UvrD-helicase domain-containing protein [Thermodesulfobacteriota bacterium]